MNDLEQKIERYDNEMLMLINMAAQDFIDPEEAKRLAMNAVKVARYRNHLMSVRHNVEVPSSELGS